MHSAISTCNSPHVNNFSLIFHNVLPKFYSINNYFRGSDNNYNQHFLHTDYNLLYYLNTTCTTESLSCFHISTIAALTRFFRYNTSLATLQILRCNVLLTTIFCKHLLCAIYAEHLCKNIYAVLPPVRYEVQHFYPPAHPANRKEPLRCVQRLFY